MCDVIPDDLRYDHPERNDPVPWCPECGGRDLWVKFGYRDGTRRQDTRLAFDPVIYCLDCLAGSIDRTDRTGRRIAVDMRLFASCVAQRERKTMERS